jgi:hypothetical protein
LDGSTTMKKLNTLEFFTGFLMGFFIGASIESILLLLVNKVYALISGKTIEYMMWMLILLIPFPIIFGIIMGKAIASLHLEDY